MVSRKKAFYDKSTKFYEENTQKIRKEINRFLVTIIIHTSDISCNWIQFLMGMMKKLSSNCMIIFLPFCLVKYTEETKRLVQACVCKQSVKRDAISSTYIRQQVSGKTVRSVSAATMSSY